MRLSVTSRRPGGVGQPPRQAAGHYGECLNWADALEQPPASLRGGLRGGPQISVRSLAPRKGALCNPTSRKAALWGCRPHGEVHSVRRTSRKTAFCNPHLTERRTLGESPSRKGAFWLRALGGGAFPPVVFEHVTESSATVRAEWDDRLPAQVHRSQKSCGGEAGLNLKAKDPPEANAPSAVPVFLGAHGLRNRVHSVTGRNRSCPPASLWRTLSLSIEARKR